MNGFRKSFSGGMVVLSLVLGSCRGGAGGASDLGIQLKLEQEKLSNGLKVILIEDHSVPLVSYQTWYRVGSVDEHLGETGMAHLFEHLMFKGTPKYGAKEFFQQLEAKGASVDAFTTRDYTVYYENFTPQLLPKVIDMESDRMVNLKLDEEVLGTERQVVLEERRLRSENTPDGKMSEALWAMAYSRHPYRFPVIGFPQDLLRITVPKLIGFYKSHYQPANATLVVVGNFNKDETLSLIKKFYGPLPAEKKPERDIPEEPEQEEERRLLLRDQVASEKLMQGYHIPSARDDDSYALDVLANILFEGTTSRAYHLLVEDKDIAAGVGGSAYTPTYPGLFVISATMKGKVPASKAEELLSQVINEVQDKGVTEEEVKVAVRQLTVQLVDSVRTPYGLGQLVGTIVTIFGDTDRFEDNLERYQRVKASDVQRVAKKYLNPNNRSVVTLVPEEASKAPKGGKK